MSDANLPEFEALRGGKIFVAGHRGMVGSAIVRRLEQAGCGNLLLKTRAEVDLLDQAQVRNLLRAERPDYVFLAAAKVGGIHANNSYPAQFIYDNTMIAANVINAAHEAGTRRLLFLGSSCIYPKMAPQPMTENALPRPISFTAHAPLAPRFTLNLTVALSLNRCSENTPSSSQLRIAGVFENRPSETVSPASPVPIR